MPNINKLKGKIVEKGINISDLAMSLGINKSTLYRKLKNNGENISIKEAVGIIDRLDLSVEEANAIFFNQFVARNATNNKLKT
ncbi:helix-turn-helix domain-containing protein [Clostridium sp. BJN0013]|uniref:helix-turn-helix domain-containing protein n=1 Tax=Clostridium sp. BJN0013 TaxID=3236840 RepID=UPI0034C6A23D